MKNSKIHFLLFLAIIISFNGFCQKFNSTKYEDTGQSITNIRVASASVLPKKWDKAQNWERIERLVRKATTEGDAKVVVTPEGALDGYV
ncbi:MAG: hypothetical protein KAI99_05540, partial [Cyclobacteriaceae bacterium]|nr:hypothetical protein [Cyclobacteriaceae bacterium]